MMSTKIEDACSRTTGLEAHKVAAHRCRAVIENRNPSDKCLGVVRDSR